MSHLQIFVVYSQHLDERMKYINSTIDFIKKKAEALNYKVDISIVSEPSREQIDKNIEAFNKRVKYEKYPEDSKENREFNSLITPLNSCQISNIEKHRIIYQNIMQQNTMQQNTNNICLILEDDVVIGQEYIQNVEILLKKLKEKTLGEWDMIFTCLPPVNTNEDSKLQLHPISSTFNQLMCKSSYIIKPAIAKRLFDFTETFKFTLKNGLSRFIYENKDIKAMYVNKHIFLEASKIGIVPTTINPNNFLFQNNQFISLVNISNKTDLKPIDIQEANALYDAIKHMDSADVLHLMGVIHYKSKDYTNAKKYMLDAIASLKKNKGYLQQNSEILNNCINMHQYEQIYLDECKQLQSKYSPN